MSHQNGSKAPPDISNEIWELLIQLDLVIILLDLLLHRILFVGESTDFIFDDFRPVLNHFGTVLNFLCCRIQYLVWNEKYHFLLQNCFRI